MDTNKIENIHCNFINGNRRDAIQQIKVYGNYDFWSDYRSYLESQFENDTMRYIAFTDAAISYFRITGR
jgi:hypothetical protein